MICDLLCVLLVISTSSPQAPGTGQVRAAFAEAFNENNDAHANTGRDRDTHAAHTPAPEYKRDRNHEGLGEGAKQGEEGSPVKQGEASTRLWDASGQVIAVACNKCVRGYTVLANGMCAACVAVLA